MNKARKCGVSHYEKEQGSGAYLHRHLGQEVRVRDGGSQVQPKLRVVVNVLVPDVDEGAWALPKHVLRQDLRHKG